MQARDVLRACPWMLEAQRLIGTREIKGPTHNAKVLRMWESIKAPFRDDETPWCAAFVGHCLESVGVKSTRSAAARSYVKWGDDWLKGFRGAYGAVVVLSRPGSAWSGHVAFLTGYDPNAEVFQLLGGNQDNRVQHSEYPASRLVALRVVPDYLGLACPRFTAQGHTSRSDA